MWELKKQEDIRAEKITAKKKRILPSLFMAVALTPLFAFTLGIKWRGVLFLSFDEAVANLPTAFIFSSLLAFLYYIWGFENVLYFCPKCEKISETKGTCSCGGELDLYSNYKWIE